MPFVPAPDRHTVRVCPCADGTLEGNFRDSEEPPHILCETCEQTHYWFWQLCWDSWEGTYWKEWVLRLRVH
jgi:hypothetical protein